MDRLHNSAKIFGLDWSTLVKSLPDIYLIVDRNGQILFINRTTDGAEIEDVLQHTVYDFTAREFHGQLAEKLHRVYDTGSEERIELKRSDPNFSEQWWSVAMSPLRQGDEIVAILYLCRDVTDLQNVRQEQQRSINSLKQKFWREISAHDRAREFLIEEIEVRRKAEDSLRASEERYRVLVENARNAIYSINVEGYFQFLNPVAARTLGGKPEDYIGRHMTELFPAEIAARQLASVQRVINNRLGESREALTYINGAPRWFITSIQPIMNSDGTCTSALLESTDIDDRVKATQQLQRERNFTSSILQTANTLIICLDSQARITVFNVECEAVTGYKFEEVVGKSWPEVFLPKELQHEGLQEFSEWVRAHPHDRYEGPIVTKSGEIRTIHWSNSSFVFEDTGELIAIAIGTDVTELKRTEERLRESELRMSLALIGTGAGLWDWDMVNDRVFYAPEWKSMLGYEEHEIENTYNAWKQLWHPDDAEKIEKAMADHLSGKTRQYVIEHRLRHKDGSWRWIMCRGGVFKDASGKPCRWVGCNVDTTPLRQIEESLAKKNEELDRYFASSLDLLCIATIDGKFIRLNPEWERVLGYSISELEGRSFLDLIHPDDLEKTRETLSRLESQEEVLSFENRYRCKDGSYRWVEWRSKPQGSRIYATARDVTDRNRMRDSLVASEARNAAILSVLPDLIFVIDSEGYYREFTGGYKDDLLVPADKVVGSHITDSIPPPLSDLLRAAVKRAISEGTSELIEYKLDLPSGVSSDFEGRFVRCGEDECLVIVRNVTERKRLELELKELNEELRLEHLALTEKNIALRVVLAQIRQEVEEVKAQVNTNVEKLILPAIDRFRRGASAKDRTYADHIESLVVELTSSFAHNLIKRTASLSPREIEICNLIRLGYQTKQIADSLILSPRTVEKFRQRIRIKLGIANQDINLATFLKSL